jgi:peroxiredoxin
LLAFFKVSCPTCQFTFPFLERIYRQLREQGVQIWGVVQDKAEDGARFAATFGVTFPILIDDSPYKVSRTYGLTHVPSLYLVKADGRIEMSSEGFCKADLLDIQKSLAQLLSATPPALFLPTERVPEYKPG